MHCSVGLITGVLGFDAKACNVIGDGALTLFLSGYAEKHHIAEADLGDVAE